MGAGGLDPVPVLVRWPFPVFSHGVWFFRRFFFFGAVRLFHGFFVEGLILAQDERWRRA